MQLASLLTLFLQGVALGLSAAASPGPFQTYLISESLSGGWRRGAPVAFAPLITDLPIILFSLFILNQMPPNFLRIISLAGGLFVFYLAWGLWNSWRQSAGKDGFQQAGTGSSLRRGVIANFLSPGPYLYWGLITGPILLSALEQSAIAGASFLAGFYATFVLCLLSLAVLFSQARRLGPRVVRSLLLVSILILVIFGGLLVWKALTA
jgi:threonine/homoserine/homoserine lactone efflux protein